MNFLVRIEAYAKGYDRLLAPKLLAKSYLVSAETIDEAINKGVVMFKKSVKDAYINKIEAS